MAIRPTQGTPVTIPPDDSTSRWGEWVAGLDTAGDTAGGVVGEIDSKAESANTGTGTLATDLTELEVRVETLEGATFPDLSGYATTQQLAAELAARSPTAISATSTGTFTPPFQSVPDGWAGSNNARLAPPPGIYRVTVARSHASEVRVHFKETQVLSVPASLRAGSIPLQFTQGDDLYLWTAAGSGVGFKVIFEKLA